jgi:hypothetical protein
VPIEIQTGSGKTENRVKLDRYAAMGRVDFSPGQEIAQSLNASLEKMAKDSPPPCPQGEHIANGDFKQLVDETNVPVDWYLTSGSTEVDRLDDQDVLAIRGAVNNAPVVAALSQVVPISASCLYEFSFLAGVVRSDPDAVAEVFWLSEQCGLQRTDSIPLLQMIKQRLVRHRARFTAPGGATQAEVRFRVPESGRAIIAKVSLAVTNNNLTNGDLEVLQEEVPVGWTLTPEGPPQLQTDFAPTGELIIDNQGNETIDISQSAAAKPGQAFTLDFDGKLGDDADLTGTPQVELRWLAADKTAVLPTSVFQIVAGNSPHSSATGTVPEQAATAEVHLILPAKSELHVQNVSLQFSEAQSVPLTFIAQAPGQLTVSDLRVGFERIPTPPPPMPPSGLCSPTPPGKIPGEKDCDSSHCSCCGEKDTMVDAAPTVTPAKRPAMMGKCANCGSTIIRTGGRLPDPGEPRVAFPAISTVKPKPAPKPAPPPLTAIAGIGKPRATQLVRAGIDSVEKLAAASPAAVANAVRGVSVKNAPHFINAARSLLETVSNQAGGS